MWAGSASWADRVLAWQGLDGEGEGPLELPALVAGGAEREESEREESEREESEREESCQSSPMADTDFLEPILLLLPQFTP